MLFNTLFGHVIFSLSQVTLVVLQGTCRRYTEDGSYCSTSLYRVSYQDIGSTESIELEGHSSYMIKTLSQKPPIFEIEDFLTTEECEHFIQVARQKGLQESKTYSHGVNTRRQIVIRDRNKDRRLSVDEMMLTLEDSYDMYLTEEDILLMYKKLILDKNHDAHLTPAELGAVNEPVLRSYLEDFVTQNPQKRSRYSKQIWLYADGRDSEDPVFNRVQDRVQKLTKLPQVLIKKSDFQVVNYGRMGHYNAHLDSSDVNKDVPCCTPKRKNECRICRFATVLFYLNDVEGGGETAFPLAGNDTYDATAFLTKHQQNLMRHCQDAKLRVFPQKGKAVLWYNHHIDRDTGWVGDIDPYTWHGGCPVDKGDKWIANFWIKFTDDPEDLLGV